MKSRLLLLLFIVNLNFASGQGVWEKPSTPWVYNFGSNTGTGQIGGPEYSTGTTGGSTVSTMPSTQGFMPYPPSGSVMLSNIAPDNVSSPVKPAGSAEWYLENDVNSIPYLKFVSSGAGRTAKLTMYKMENATSVASFFYKISFSNNVNNTAMDWRFVIGRNDGTTNLFSNTTGGSPAKTSTSGFADVFSTIRWSGTSDVNIPLTYCYRGVVGNGETAGTTYERALDGVTFSKGGSYNMEFYCNNSSESQKYVRGQVTYTIAINSMHIWANGIQLTANTSANIPSYQLAQDKKLDAIMLQGSTSTPAKTSSCNISTLQVNHVQNPLPVSLKSFKGTSKGASVLLKWSTASEKNNAGFDVLRKSDDLGFKIIGHVAGVDNSSDIKNYSFTDYNPLPGTNYYQLKQLDHDGKFSLSNVLALSSSGDQELKIYVNDEGKLMASVFCDKAFNSSAIILTDLSGKIILTMDTPLKEGENRIALNVNNLLKGVYTASLLTSENKVSTKFIQ